MWPSNDAENSALHNRNKLHLKKKYSNRKLEIFNNIFKQINSALVSVTSLKNIKIIAMTFEQ